MKNISHYSKVKELIISTLEKVETQNNPYYESSGLWLVKRSEPNIYIVAYMLMTFIVGLLVGAAFGVY